MKWRSKVRARNTPSEQELALTRAYGDVFGKQNESVEMVLADLASFTGFYSVAPPGTTGDALQYDAGMRAAFGRLYHFLTMSDEQLRALEEAARAESEHLNS